MNDPFVENFTRFVLAVGWILIGMIVWALDDGEDPFGLIFSLVGWPVVVLFYLFKDN